MHAGHGAPHLAQGALQHLAPRGEVADRGGGRLCSLAAGWRGQQGDQGS